MKKKLLHIILNIYEFPCKIIAWKLLTNIQYYTISNNFKLLKPCTKFYNTFLNKTTHLPLLNSKKKKKEKEINKYSKTFFN